MIQLDRAFYRVGITCRSAQPETPPMSLWVHLNLNTLLFEDD
jgi:hypothetical protein